MSNREHLMSFAAFTVLVALSGVARGDDYSNPNLDRFARVEEPQPMTCAQATAFAWFKNQMELGEGGRGNVNDVATPAECERTNVAAKGDAEVTGGSYEESK